MRGGAGGLSVRRSGGELDEYAIYALLMNWSKWARGGAAHTGYPMVWINDISSFQAPDEQAAQRVEAIMVVMRREAPGLWKAARLRYISRVTDITASRACGLDVESFRARILSAYTWFAERWIDADR